jgi:hypothetical protein
MTVLEYGPWLGAFDAVDCAMMTHPCPADTLYPSVLAIQEVVVMFHGKTRGVVESRASVYLL